MAGTTLSPPLGMEEAINPFGHRLVDPLDPDQIDHHGAANALGRAEGVEQGLRAAGPDALDVDQGQVAYSRGRAQSDPRNTPTY